MPSTDRKQPESPPAERTRFKDRGTDESEWRGAFGTSGTSQLRKLQDPALAIAEDAPLHEGKIPVNAAAFKKGYNPSTAADWFGAMPRRRRDLRRLGEWLKLCMQLKNSKQREE
jgi:hypothetical protein